jgi:hypothetical protein
LEEIHEQPHRGIQARQRRRGFQTLELGLDTDNDSVFMNETVRDYCQ